MTDFNMSDIAVFFQNNTPSCIKPEYCFEKCLEWKVEVGLEFVWFFVFGFLFTEGTIFVHNLKIRHEIRNKIVFTMKWIGLILNFIGIVWFFIILL